MPLTLILPAMLSACGPREGERNLDSLDAELLDRNASANSRDPALMGALQDQIMVDPALASQANNDAVRPPAQPYSGAVPLDGIATPGGGGAVGAASIAGAGTSQTLKSAPNPSNDCPGCKAARESLTLGALAARQGDTKTASCASGLRYSTRWAQRMPADLPVYPDARVSEAAGSDEGGCAIRAVSFATAAPLQTVVDYYYTRAAGAGYSAEHQADGTEHVLGGTRQRDDAAYAVFLISRPDGGTDVDIVANKGR